MRDIFDILEYLSDRCIHSLVDLKDVVEELSEDEKLLRIKSSLLVLQGELMSLRDACARARAIEEEKIRRKGGDA